MSCQRDPEEASDDFMFKEALAPIGENYDSWNVTRDGIRFNFDACKVFSCAEGKQEVEIPFAALKQWLNPDTSVSLLAIPTRSIKEVDFKNFTYPWYPSGYNPPYNVRRVALENGEYFTNAGQLVRFPAPAHQTRTHERDAKALFE
jgi:hypothetical protein